MQGIVHAAARDQCSGTQPDLCRRLHRYAPEQLMRLSGLQKQLPPQTGVPDISIHIAHPAQVKRTGSGSIGIVRSGSTGQSEIDIILGAQNIGCLFVYFRLVFAHPHDLEERITGRRSPLPVVSYHAL